MFEAIQSSYAAVSGALNIVKQFMELIPESPHADELQKQLDATARQLKLAEAQIAKELAYEICKCTFPPQIMLYDKGKDADVCPACGCEIGRPQVRCSVHDLG